MKQTVPRRCLIYHEKRCDAYWRDADRLAISTIRYLSTGLVVLAITFGFSRFLRRKRKWSAGAARLTS